MKIKNKCNIVIDGDTDPTLIHNIWNKAKIEHTHDTKKIRFDKYNTKLCYSDYCNFKSKYGWCIIFTDGLNYKKNAFTIPVNVNNLHKLDKIYLLKHD